jgi:ubiquinone/menaquinone biosynthesis C-methylase UbiE
MDADFSHNPYIIKRLLSERYSAHILIASRYARGGFANMPFTRKILSVMLNSFLSFGLSLPVRDLTSGFRLYNSEIFKEVDFSEKNFDVLVEILVKAYMNGFRVKEIPFHYQPRTKGRSHAKVFRFGLDFLKTFFRLWKIRNTINSVDYDYRAFDSRIPLQRFWQRQRYKIITNFAGYENRILDVGCGSSRVLSALSQAIGMDINLRKLRFNLSIGNLLVNADIGNICFKDSYFDVVICSEVIEHLKKENNIFLELRRVLKKGGILILGTPDYSTYSWNLIEWLYKKAVPNGYVDEHISHYTKKELVQYMENIGFKLKTYQYILGCELICKFEKIV